MRASRLAGLLAVLVLVAPDSASAHPMGNFSISHYAAIRVEPDGVRLRYVLDLAEIPTFQALQAEGLPAEPEHPGVRAYLARTVEALADGLTVELDGRRLPLRSEGAELLFPPGAGGLPTLKLGVVYRAALPRGDGPSTAVLAYRDGNYPERAGWKEIVATAAPGVTLVASTVPERDRSRELSRLPDRSGRDPAAGARGPGRLRARDSPDPGRRLGAGAGEATREPGTARIRGRAARQSPPVPDERARARPRRDPRLPIPSRRTAAPRPPPRRRVASARTCGGRRATRSPP